MPPRVSLRFAAQLGRLGEDAGVVELSVNPGGAAGDNQRQGLAAALSRVLASVGVGVARVSWIVSAGPGGLTPEEVGAAKTAPGSGAAAAASAPQLRSARFHVGGMSCASCVASLEGVLGRLPGVASVSVSLLGEEAVVEFDPSVCVVHDMKEAIEDAGFSAELRVQVRADRCVCATALWKHLRQMGMCRQGKATALWHVTWCVGLSCAGGEGSRG